MRALLHLLRSIYALYSNTRVLSVHNLCTGYGPAKHVLDPPRNYSAPNNYGVTFATSCYSTGIMRRCVITINIIKKTIIATFAQQRNWNNKLKSNRARFTEKVINQIAIQLTNSQISLQLVHQQ